jgi:hypothetical protein
MPVTEEEIDLTPEVIPVQFPVPARAIRRAEEQQIQAFDRRLIPASILGVGLIAALGMLLYTYLPGDRARLLQLESEVEQLQKQVQIANTQLTQQNELIEAQHNTIRLLRLESEAKSDALETIKSALETLE